MKRVTTSLSLLLALSLSSFGWGQRLSETGALLEYGNGALAELESEFGNHSPQLVPSLVEMADLFRSDGLYAEAYRMLDRATQVIRVSEGLYTKSQIPLIRRKVENYADWGDWDNARRQLEHLFWLHRTKSGQIDSSLIAHLMALNELHLRGISEDNYEFQTFHFRRAARVNWLALEVAERLWSPTDSRLVPILYSLVKHYHLQAVAVKQGGKTGYELRQIVPGADLVRERDEIRRYFYATGLRLLDQLRSIQLAQAPIALEGAAMANLYTADWHLLFNEEDAALAAYRRAYEELSYAGKAADELEQFFAVPSVLPVHDFYDSLKTASSLEQVARASQSALQPSLVDDLPGKTDQAHLFFAEWGPSFPYISSPDPVDQDLSRATNAALFSFDISGVMEMTRFVSRRQVRSVAQLLNIDLVRPTPVSLEVREEMIARLEHLQLRPRLTSGYPVEASATLIYLSAAGAP
ncbi:MAG: hypothetical protein CMQ45_07140 [Gammaproteobacteria bacterium]|nr:hypothetical protein [Gammaproteobacteria bacterium]